jgi:hypothetical protein
MNRSTIIRAIGSAAFLIVSASPLYAADIRLEGYRNPKNENFRILNQLYLDGVRGGLLSYSSWLKSRGGPPAFCSPQDVPMTTEVTEEIMLKSAARRSAKGDTPISSLLLWGLQDTYPCPGP